MNSMVYEVGIAEEEMNKNRRSISIELKSVGKINLAFDEKIEESNETEVKKPDEPVEFQHKEGGWGWVVVAAVTLTYGFVLSTWTNYSLIYPKYIEFYNQTENNVALSAWIGSISFGVQFITSAFSSILIDLFGQIKIGVCAGILSTIGLVGSAVAFRTVIQVHFLTYGLIFGFAQSLMMATAFSILPHYFNKKLGLVNGLINTGGCLIVIGSSFGVGWLLSSHGITVTFFVLATVSLLISLLSLVFIPQLPVSNEYKTFKQRVKESLGLEIFKKPKYVLWVLASVVGLFGNGTPVITMGHYSTLNFPAYKPEILNMVYGITSGLCSLVFGKVIDSLKFSVAYNYIASYLVYGITTFFIQHITNFYLYIVVICFLGAFDGLFLCSLLPMAYETAGSSKLVNQALGFYNTFISITIVAGPATAGYLFELYNTYHLAYLLSAISSLIAALILSFYPNIYFHKFYKLIKMKLLLKRTIILNVNPNE